MSDIAVDVRHLSKAYKISRQHGRYKTLQEDLVGIIKRPFAGRSRTSRKELFWALDDVTFQVKQGEVLGIIGRNGAGKSTLLKILSRITRPTRGYVEITGRVGSLLEVGTGFHPELSGRENIFLNGAILGMRRQEIRRQFDEIVAFAEVEKFLDTPVKRYSSGMYMRLAFAVAAHLNPEILVVDEVLAVGDAAFQKKSLGKMTDVAHDGRTVLFVSHNMAAVSQLCSKVAWLDRGSIKTLEDPDSAIQKYMQEGTVSDASRKWSTLEEAPGDDKAKLLEARVLQANNTAHVVDINLDMYIELSFALFEDTKNFVTGIYLYNSEQICLFAHCDWRSNNLQRGIYRKWVKIPAQTLAEGRFSVLVQTFVFEPLHKHVFLPDLLMFDAIDSANPLSVRGLYKENWPGVVRLGLEWGDAEFISTLG